MWEKSKPVDPVVLKKPAKKPCACPKVPPAPQTDPPLLPENAFVRDSVAAYLSQAKKGTPVDTVKKRLHSQVWHSEMTRCKLLCLDKDVMSQRAAETAKAAMMRFEREYNP